LYFVYTKKILIFEFTKEGKDKLEPDDVIEFFDELKLDPQDVCIIDSLSPKWRSKT
jgi:hypothetical protein